MSHIPESKTIPALMDELARLYPAREAVVGSGQRLNYVDLQVKCREIARTLYRRNVRAGDKVAILMGNQPEWLTSALAVISLGAVVVALNTWATPAELEYLIAHSDATLVIATPRFLKADYGAMLRDFKPGSKRFPLLRGVIGVGSSLPPGWLPLLDGQTGDEASVDASIDAASRAVRPDDVALMLFTSGSTARPKGVLLQHRGLIENSWHTGERQRITENDRLWLAVSLFWGMATATAVWNLFAHGGCIVLQMYYDTGEALRLIEVERCTVFYGTPNIVQAMIEHPDRAKHDLSSLRTGGTSGTPDMMERVIALGVTEICNIYGLTETHGHTHMSDVDDSRDRRMRSIGRIMPGTQQKVVSPDGAELPAGQVGELLIKGYITAGYYKQPELTAQCFDADRYFRTGDLVMLDEDGYLHFRGRLKELIKSGGINISPVEVEYILKLHPGVSAAMVVGAPDTTMGEVVAAVIIPKDGVSLTEAEIIDYCKPLMAAYKVPRLLRFAAEHDLPLTTTGKLQKNLIAHKFFA